MIHTSAIAGSSGHSPVDFGDWSGIRISGQVFSDTNVNGINDSGESGVPGVAIDANTGALVHRVATGSTGVYTLYLALHSSNPITITETDPLGFTSTNAVPGVGMAKVDANTLRIPCPSPQPTPARLRWGGCCLRVPGQ